MKKNNQNGIVSLFVIFAMVILLVFVILIYYSVEAQVKIQDIKKLEYQAIYSENYQEINNVEYAADNEIIPIYNIDEFNIVGTNNYIQIKKKIYECGRDKSYILKDNIIVDIEEKIKTKSVGINDYKLYSDTYLIDKASYNIYYYGYGVYWKLIYYKKYENRDISVNNKTYEDREFSILNSIKFDTNKNYRFFALWTDEENEFNNEKLSAQKITKSQITNLNELQVYNNIKNNLYESGELCIFVELEESI